MFVVGEDAVGNCRQKRTSLIRSMLGRHLSATRKEKWKRKFKF